MSNKTGNKTGNKAGDKTGDKAGNASMSKPAPEPKVRAPGIGDLAMRLIREGKPNAEVLAEIKEQFPSAATTMASVNWYRNKLRQDGENVPTARSLSAEAQAEIKAMKAMDKAEAKAIKDAEKAEAKAIKDAEKAEAKAIKDAEKAEAKAKAKAVKEAERAEARARVAAACPELDEPGPKAAESEFLV